jgi:hypothetical protein
VRAWTNTHLLLLKRKSITLKPLILLENLYIRIPRRCLWAHKRKQVCKSMIISIEKNILYSRYHIAHMFCRGWYASVLQNRKEPVFYLKYKLQYASYSLLQSIVNGLVVLLIFSRFMQLQLCKMLIAYCIYFFVTI